MARFLDRLLISDGLEAGSISARRMGNIWEGIWRTRRKLQIIRIGLVLALGMTMILLALAICA